jgi:hypothetical protein
MKSRDDLLAFRLVAQTIGTARTLSQPGLIASGPRERVANGWPAPSTLALKPCLSRVSGKCHCLTTAEAKNVAASHVNPAFGKPLPRSLSAGQSGARLVHDSPALDAA